MNDANKALMDATAKACVEVVQRDDTIATIDTYIDMHLELLAALRRHLIGATLRINALLHRVGG